MAMINSSLLLTSSRFSSEFNSIQLCIELAYPEFRGRQPDEGTMNEHVQTATSRLLFNPLAPEVIRNPYPYYERLRTTDPMHLTPLGLYVASRHAEVSLVLRDKRDRKSTRLNSSHSQISYAV